MTAQEAQTYVDKGWNRWVPVTAALVEIEKAATQPQQTDPEPQPTEEPESTDPQTNLVQVDQTVIDAVTDWRNEQAAGTQHYERWDRVLAAFGTVDRTDAMTAQEAQGYADKGWNRWVQIVDVLEDIEAAAQQQQQGALENPQYAQQQDQLPSTQQDQQLTPIPQEYKRVKAQGLAIHHAIANLWTWTFNEVFYNQAKYDQLKFAELRNMLNLYNNDRNNPSWLIITAENNNQQADYVERIKQAIPRAEETYAQMRTLQGELYYGTILYSCPPDLQDDDANRNFMSKYRNGTVMSSGKIVYDPSGVPVVLDGSRVVNHDGTTGNTYVRGLSEGRVYNVGTTNNKIALLDRDNTYRLVGTVDIRNDGFANSLEDRLCAYHDLTSNSDRHTKLVKQAMLALSINPEAPNIEPMTVDKAEQMKKIYDNAEYKWGLPGGAQEKDGYSHWKESLWEKIAEKIHDLDIKSRP